MIKIVKKTGIALLAPVLIILTAVFMPVLIWVAAFVGIRHAIVEKRESRKLNSGNISCRADTDCPRGFYCVNGRCAPLTAEY